MEAEQGGTYHTPSLDLTAGDSLELRGCNPAEWDRCQQKCLVVMPRNITQEVPMYTQGAFQSLFRSWILNHRDSLPVEAIFWREAGQLSR